MSNRSVVDQAQLGRRRGGGQECARWSQTGSVLLPRDTHATIKGHARYNARTYSLVVKTQVCNETGTHTLRYTLATTRQFKSLNLCVFVCVSAKLLAMRFHLNPKSQYGIRVMCKFCPSHSPADYRVT